MKRLGITPLAAALLAAVTLAVSGCASVHEPWVNNGKQWKEQRFQSKVPNQALQQRLLTGQTDR